MLYLQDIVGLMVNALILNHGFPPQFDQVVLHLWLLLVNAFHVSFHDRSLLEEKTWNPSNSTDIYDSGSESILTEEEARSSVRSSVKDPSHAGFQQLMQRFSSRYLLSLLYLGNRLLRMPFLMHDFVRYSLFCLVYKVFFV